MALSINWGTRVITVPQADLTPISGSKYELDVNAFRLALKDLEDSTDGICFPKTHKHNTQVTLSGVTYARIVEIINGYTITFQDTGSPYTVRCVGANHNIDDAKNVNQVSLIIGNSAGLIVVSGGSGASAAEVWAHGSRTLSTAPPTAAENAAATVGALGATTIPVDVKKMNTASVIGDGTNGNAWRGVGVSP